MGAAAGRAVPRTGRPITRGSYPTRVAPRGVDVVPFRSHQNRSYYNRSFYNRSFYNRSYSPYRYGYRPGLRAGYYSGLRAPYRYGFYGYPYDYDYPYNYTYFRNYGYRYPYTSYGYALPPGYVTAVPGYAYGGVRITGAPHDAEVYVDGNYVGRVDDFDGAFQHANLRPGPHRVEIRAPGLSPTMFSVNVAPGQTITYHAR